MGKPPRLLLIFIIYGTMTIFGLVENIKGVSYPLIKAEFNASYEQQGLMVSLLAVSYVVFCTLGGIFLGHFGVKRALLSGFIGLGLGLSAVFFMSRFWSVAGALLLVFAGFGFFEIGLNALASQVFTSKAALLMNLLHFFYGFGAVLGPKIAGFLSGRAGLGWRQIYILSLPLAGLFFILAAITRFPETGGAARKTGNATFFTALKTPMVWVFGITLGLMVIIEMITVNWGGLYFQDVYGLDPRTSGASFISGFFILFSLSRFLSGFLVEKIGYLRSLLGASLAAALICGAGFLSGARAIWILPALGFFLAIMWPTLMAVAIGFFGSRSPVMTSAIIVIAGATNAAVQLLVGLTNRFLGAAWGYRSSFVYTLLLIGAILFLKSRVQGSRK
jgi:fucose permease